MQFNFVTYAEPLIASAAMCCSWRRSWDHGITGNQDTPWGFRSSGTWHCTVVWKVHSVSKERNVSTFESQDVCEEWPFVNLLTLESGSTEFLKSVRKYSTNTAVWQTRRPELSLAQLQEPPTFIPQTLRNKMLLLTAECCLCMFSNSLLWIQFKISLLHLYVTICAICVCDRCVKLPFSCLTIISLRA